jgi:hypothetical protein
MNPQQPSDRRGTGFAGPLAVPPGGRRRSRFGGIQFTTFLRPSLRSPTTNWIAAVAADINRINTVQ